MMCTGPWADTYVVGAGELGVRVGGGIHGLTFLTYCVVTVLAWVNQRWDAKTGVSLYVRRPLPMAVVTLVGVGVVFGLLLSAGPPTEWFA